MWGYPDPKRISSTYFVSGWRYKVISFSVRDELCLFICCCTSFRIFQNHWKSERQSYIYNYRLCFRVSGGAGGTEVKGTRHWQMNRWLSGYIFHYTAYCIGNMVELNRAAYNVFHSPEKA